MRLILLICAVCLLALAFGCKRSGQQSANNSVGPATVFNNLDGDRGRARALVEQGKALYRDDNDQAAVEKFQEALKADPNLAEARFRLGLGYRSLGKHEEAEAEFKKTGVSYKKYLEEHDGEAEAYYDLGVAHTKLAQYDAAAAAFSKSLEIDPNNYRAQDGLDDAKEGIQRIKVGRKHQEDLLKKQKEDEMKKAGASPSPGH